MMVMCDASDMTRYDRNLSNAALQMEQNTTGIE